MPNINKSQSAFQRFKAPLRKTLLYQVIFHPIRSLKRFKESLEMLGMSDDEKYFYTRHKEIFGYKPDFKHPQTFNEKIIHRILYDRKPIYTALADKLKARIYIAHRLQGFTQASIGATRERERERETNSNLNLTETHTNSTFLNSTDDILKATSPLFAPIDSLDEILFNTNLCEFLPKLYGIWKSVDDIDFDKLPNAFALKTNHDCGGVVLVPDKQSFLANKQVFDESMQKLKEHLATNYYELYREWHYKDIEPRVFAEELLGANCYFTTNSTAHNPNLKQSIENDDFQDKKEGESNAYNAPDDYKFHCFGNAISKHIYIQVDTERFTNHSRTIFDSKWQKMNFEICFPMPNYVPKQPKNLALMLQVAKVLSQDLNVRVDLYNPCNCVIVGELTFTHGGGTEKFNPPEWDKRFGEMWG